MVMDNCNLSEGLTLGPDSGFSRENHLAAFVSYWESMRKLGDVPHRSEIDPRGIGEQHKDQRDLGKPMDEMVLE